VDEIKRRPILQTFISHNGTLYEGGGGKDAPGENNERDDLEKQV
jgi:hypothetical protein